MVTEGVCLEIVLKLYGRETMMEEHFDTPGSEMGDLVIQRYKMQDALSHSDCYLELLGTYTLSTIDDNMRWLELAGFIRRVKGGIPELWQLTPSGEEFAR